MLSDIHVLPSLHSSPDTSRSTRRGPLTRHLSLYYILTETELHATAHVSADSRAVFLPLYSKFPSSDQDGVILCIPWCAAVSRLRPRPSSLTSAHDPSRIAGWMKVGTYFSTSSIDGRSDHAAFSAQIGRPPAARAAVAARAILVLVDEDDRRPALHIRGLRRWCDFVRRHASDLSSAPDRS